MRKSRENGLFLDIPDEQWNDWGWQVRNRIETLEELKKYINLTKDEEEGVAATLGKLRMAITPYYLSLIDLDDPFDPIRKQAIPPATSWSSLPMRKLTPCTRTLTPPAPA